MKAKRLFILPLLAVCFFVFCSSAQAMPAPRPAQTFYFTQVEKISPTENKVTIFEKQSCFSSQVEECLESNNDENSDTLLQGSGYNSGKYSELGAYDAIPIISFVFNKDDWEVYEYNESQILRSLKGDKEIVLYADGLAYSPDFGLASEVVEEFKKGELNKVNVSDYEIINDLIFVFGDSSVNGSQRYYTITPFPILLKAKNISDQDKLDFKKIINTLEISKQNFGNLIWQTYEYPQGSYPRLFDNVDDLVRWAQMAGKTFGEQKSLNSVIFNIPFDDESFYAEAVVPEAIKNKLENSFDYPPQYNDKNVSFVGTNNDCETSNEVICLDDGSSWDYLAKKQTEIAPNADRDVTLGIMPENHDTSLLQKFKYFSIFAGLFIVIVIFVIYLILRKRKMKKLANETIANEIIENETNEIDEANNENQQNE